MEFRSIILAIAIAFAVPAHATEVTEVRLEGDSYMSGAYGFGLSQSLSAYFAKITMNARGGSTMDDIFSRVTAVVKKKPELNSTYTIIWDGQANGYTSLDGYVDTIKKTVSLLTGSYLVITPVAVGKSKTGAPDSWAATMVDIYERLVEIGINAFNPYPILASLSNGSLQDTLNVSAGLVPWSLRATPSDGVHLNDATMDAVAASVYARVTVPGPIAGAGIPALLALVGYGLYRRRETAGRTAG